METLAQAQEHGRRVRDAAGHSQHYAQHDRAEDDVELVGELLRDRVVQHHVDEGADRRPEERGRPAKECHDDRLRVGRPVEHLGVCLLLVQDEEASRHAGEQRRDRVDGQLVRLYVDADRGGALPVLAGREQSRAERRAHEEKHQQETHPDDCRREVIERRVVAQLVGHCDRDTVVAARKVVPRKGEREEQLGDGEREEREIQSDRPLRDQPGHYTDRRCRERRRGKTQQDGKVIALEDQGDRVSADAVVGGVRERDHARITEHQVVRDRPQSEHQR